MRGGITIFSFLGDFEYFERYKGASFSFEMNLL